MEINIDKSNWSKVNFGDVAIQMKGTVDRDNTDLRYYVKGEHMNSEDVHIREFGELTDEYLGPAFIRHFKEGDILYGSRRTYLKKVAVAHFEGITSNTTFVINAKENVIDKRLLPFLMLSDKFTEHSIMHSKGSVNPYINWKDLANYEFLLPPKEQQAELAELLWAMDTVIENDLEVLERLEKNIQNLFLSKIIDFNIEGSTITGILDNLNKKLGLGLLKDFGTFLKGKGISKDDVIESGIPCIRYGEIYTNHHIVIRKFRSFISEDVANTSLQLNKGDIVFAGSGETITEIGKSVCFVDDFEAYAGGDTIIFRPDTKKINSVYLSYLLNSLIIRLQLNKMGTGATVAHIYPEDLKKIRIPLLDISIQNGIAVEMETIFKSIDQLKSKLQSSKALQKALINQVF
ncbi:restriction endonuclease subunit S [Sphingobacterium sp. FBM7-1]|uniref:restriction endonuclease subunit S n=1 Tax=Sphingobacterium sp. FBM7-1 TaxID=2886688 RepID=UPI001D100D37|nr:restriction endonuclease subunit S [Sphingobacterium sp. FBM7-1]MCC2598428.1 restriction endonuclease subunit S [Sphingobacterium sp. FBM7-1]